MIFVDTSAFFALANRADPRHPAAKEILSRCLNQKENLVTHNYILVECFALMHQRLGKPTARHFYKEVEQLCRTLWVSQALHQRAAKTYIPQRGGKLSFVDCVSFELMRHHKIRRYFAFDANFKRQGFEAV